MPAPGSTTAVGSCQQPTATWIHPIFLQDHNKAVILLLIVLGSKDGHTEETATSLENDFDEEMDGKTQRGHVELSG